MEIVISNSKIGNVTVITTESILIIQKRKTPVRMEIVKKTTPKDQTVKPTETVVGVGVSNAPVFHIMLETAKAKSGTDENENVITYFARELEG